MGAGCESRVIGPTAGPLETPLDMTRLHETIRTALPVHETFALIAEFANAQRWGPRASPPPSGSAPDP